ncbi:MAG: leucine-rich repeat domain-containing protein [Lachnospiraceae bacterium]
MKRRNWTMRAIAFGMSSVMVCTTPVLAQDLTAGGSVFTAEQQTTNSDFQIVNGVLIEYKGNDMSVVIPQEVTSIGDGAFDGCTNLISVTIPDSVTSIGLSAFNGCDRLTSVVIPDSVQNIGDGAFCGCGSLLNVTLPKNLETIGDETFEGCGTLLHINLPETVKIIGTDAFYSCSSLQDITLPDSVISIGNTAFSNCENLKKAYIPASVQSIGADAFSGCDQLLLRGVEGSKAESYAKENAISFTTKSMDEKENQKISYTKSYTKTYGVSGSFYVNVNQTFGDGKLTYKTSNKKVATVSTDGEVKLIGSGIAYITASAAANTNYNAKSVKIKLVVNPNKPALKVKRVKAQKVTASWKALKKISGYQLQYSTDKKFKKGVKTVKISSKKKVWSSPSLKVNKTYYVRMRAYTATKDGSKKVTLTSKWSSVKSTGKIK